MKSDIYSICFHCFCDGLYILSAGPFHIEIHLDGLLSQYYFLMKQELHIIYFVSLDKFRFYFGLCGMVNIQFLIQEIFSIYLGRRRVGLNTLIFEEES